MVNAIHGRKRRGPWADPGTPPANPDAPRNLRKNVVSLKEIQEQLRQGVGIRFVTRRCADTVADLGWGEEQVRSFVLSLEDRNYWGSEWSRIEDGAWLRAAAYVGMADAIHPAIGSRRQMPVYIKFTATCQGTIALLVVSCHEARDGQ